MCLTRAEDDPLEVTSWLPQLPANQEAMLPKVHNEDDSLERPPATLPSPSGGI